MIKNLLLIFGMLLGIGMQSQLVVDASQSPATIVENVFLANGIFVSNITYNGGDASIANAQVGTFDASATPLGIESGIIMATGDIAVAIGPNNNGGMTLGGNSSFGSTDPDLVALVPGYTSNDWSILEFDFIATGDSLAFEYIFGSEEFQEYVNSTFNDHFAFFISGPGISGTYSNSAVNIAQIPGTSDPVSINTVNEGMNSSYFMNNDNVGTLLNGTIQFDGLTVPLMACIGQLSIGEVYHIKLAIADAGDSVLDSGVFLGGDSFQQFCTETVDLQGSSDRDGQCMLSEVRSHVNYTETCGTVEFVNTSEVNLAYTDVYYEINGEDAFNAEGTVVHTFTEAGTYNIKLVYEYNEFRAKYTLNPLIISLVAPEEPLFHATGSTLFLDNYDGSSLIQWFFNGVEIAGANATTFAATENGDYSVTVNNGCPAHSDVQTLTVGTGELVHTTLRLYPNPCKGQFFMEYPGTNIDMMLYDNLGNLLKTAKFSSRDGVELPSPGIYSVVLRDAAGVILVNERVISL